MELDKLKFVLDKTGNISDEERQVLIDSYKELFIEIYGYDILSEYLKSKSNLKNYPLFQDTFIGAIDVLKSVRENDEIDLLKIYDENNNIVGFGRLKKTYPKRTKNPILFMADKLFEKHLNVTNEHSISVPDVAIASEYQEYRYEIWKRLIAFIEDYVISLGYNKLYIEIPLNSPLLLKADDLGFVESPEDIPVTEKPRTRILNKYLERTKDAEFNSSRK